MKAFVASWIDSVLGEFAAYRRWRLGLWIWKPSRRWPKWSRSKSIGLCIGHLYEHGVWMEGY